ncbi:MAG: Permease of the drug/metabolite transporter superfamily [Hyphomicrobiales bacterium]|nr:Permease of the drug/metabolite transporter superfamily [Hyphomicrobiales bacterium]
MTKRFAAQGTGLLTAVLARPYFMLVLTTLFWGGNVVAGKLAVGNIDPFAFMIFRWSGAFLAVLPFAIKPLRRDLPVIRKHWILFLFYGAIGMATFNVLLYLSAYYTSGVNAALEQVAINIFTMAGNFVLFRLRVRWLQLVGVAATILGVALTATHGNLARIFMLDINLGDALVLLASLAYAVYSIGLRYRPAVHWMSFIAAVFVAALVASLAFQFLLNGGLAPFLAAIPAITPKGWLLVLYVALLPSIISQLFYARAVELIGANRASLFINLIPLFGALLSVLILGEQLQPYHLAAAGLVILGLVLAEFAARRRQPAML